MLLIWIYTRNTSPIGFEWRFIFYILHLTWDTYSYQKVLKSNGARVLHQDSSRDLSIYCCTHSMLHIGAWRRSLTKRVCRCFSEHIHTVFKKLNGPYPLDQQQQQNSVLCHAGLAYLPVCGTSSEMSGGAAGIVKGKKLPVHLHITFWAAVVTLGADFDTHLHWQK